MTEMNVSRIKLMFGFFGIIFLLSACSATDQSNINSAAANNEQISNSTQVLANDDVEELGKIIKLPIEPEEATYSESNLNDKVSAPSASNTKKFLAVLKFSAENAVQIAASAGKYKSPTPADVEAESWFPPELVAQSQISGDEALKGVAYSADDFIQTPFNSGKLTRINNTDYFVLELVAVQQ